MSGCVTTLKHHIFEKVGEFDGEDVLECMECRCRLVGYWERWFPRSRVIAEFDAKTGELLTLGDPR